MCAGWSKTHLIVASVAEFRPCEASWVGIILDKMAVDSAATFKKRAVQVGLLSEDLTRMEELGWSTYGSLALASEGQPGNVADDAFKTSVLEKALPGAAQVRAPGLKRLYLEAYSACLLDIKRTVEAGTDESAPKVPEIEKVARLESFKQKFPGTRVEGLHEPASSLIDEYMQMARTGAIKYLDWSKLLSREEELAAKKKTNLKVSVVKWTAESQGLVASTAGEDLGETALHSDYLIRCALHRRAVAVHVSGVLDYLVHEQASELYFKRRFDNAPAGYRIISWDQVQHADEHLWKQLAQETRSGCTPAGGTVFPADNIFTKLLEASDFLLYLRPLPSSQASTSTSATKGGQDNKKRPPNHNTGQQQQQKRPAEAAPAVDPKRKRLPRMPEELKGGCAQTQDGQAICFAYNMKSGCPSKLPPGSRCSRGLHVCCKKINDKACGEKHPQHEHRS